MTLAELIRAFRDEIKDTIKPYLVSDDAARRYANQAQIEAARRARLLVDSSSDLCRIDYSAGEPVIDTDSRIVSLRRVRIETAARPLRLAKAAEMDEEFCGWDSSTSQSRPFIAVVDYGTDQLRLYPTPATAGTLCLTVTREPLNLLVNDEDSPEIPRRLHDRLIPWMKHRAYGMQDSDLYDAKQAALSLAEFEQEFGAAIGAINERFAFENYHDVGER